MTQTENVFDSADAVARWRASAERRAAWLGEATERMLDAAGVESGARVLDLGTGTGDTAVLAGLRAGPQGRVLATEVSEAMLQAAAEAAAAAGLDNVECQRQDAGALVGLEPDSFDSVIARFSLMFVADVSAALTGIRTVLKPGGRLGALVWAPTECNPFLELPVLVARRTGRLKVPEEQISGPFRLSDAAKLEQAARAAGLEAAVEEVPLEVRLPNRAVADEAVHSSPRTGSILEALTDSERDAYEADLAAELERHRAGEGYRFGGLAFLLRGRKLA